MRPGELLDCPNATQHPGGCGTGLNCRYCGVVSVLLEARGGMKRVVRDARMFIRQDENKYVPFDVTIADRPLCLDPVLAKRAVLNVLKNALEATSPGGEIRFILEKHGEGIEFRVSNDGVMSDEVQSQMFQRSFSTKGRVGE